MEEISRIDDIDLAHEMALAMDPIMERRARIIEYGQRILKIYTALKMDEHTFLDGFDVEKVMESIETRAEGCLKEADTEAQIINELYEDRETLRELLGEMPDVEEIDRFAGWRSKFMECEEITDKIHMIRAAIENKQKIIDLLVLTNSQSTVDELSDGVIREILEYIDSL